MKYRHLVLLFAFFALSVASCKKDHYDVSNVHGVNAEGEVLLPVASKSFAVKDLMDRFELTDLIHWDEMGDMSLYYNLDLDSVLNGSDMLKFKDLDYTASYSCINPYPNTPPPYVDTVLSFERTITFESEHVFVKEGWVKSGRLDFEVESNAGNVQHVVLRSSNIKDAAGNDFVLDIPVHANTFGFDLTGLHYRAEDPNTLNISYEVTVNTPGTSDPELYLDVHVGGHDLAFREMRGFVEQYERRDRMDTLFSLFSDGMDGLLELDGVRIKVEERNTFDIGARFVVDTLTVWSDGLAPYSIFEPLPLPIEMPPTPQFDVALNRLVSGRINAAGGRLLASGNFIVNPEGVNQMVTVSDTNRVDLRAAVEIPFSFNVGDIYYHDTVNMNLANLDLPDFIKQLTLELTFTSLLPLNLNASFFMYSSESQMITDTLLTNAALIKASFDGKPTTTEVTLVVDEDRVEKVLHSDRIIMSYKLDSEHQDIDLNVNQRLDLSLKGKAKYKGNLEFNSNNL